MCLAIKIPYALEFRLRLVLSEYEFSEFPLQQSLLNYKISLKHENRWGVVKNVNTYGRIS